MTEQVLKKESISGIKDLPVLPEVAAQLLKIIHHASTSATDVANLISKDIGITSKVLRMANSAFYGIPRTITTVQNAVVLLGMKVVNSLVLSASVGTLFPPEKKSSGVDKKSFWVHSLACAIASKKIAEKIKLAYVDPEECFCAGLLHDIGKLVLNQYFKDSFIKSVNLAKIDNLPAYKAECKIFDCSHTRVGDWLTCKWELPIDLRNALIFHHDPASSSTSEKITFIIHLADYITHVLDMATYKDEVLPRIHPDTQTILEITDQDIISIKEYVPKEIEKLEVAFNFS